MKKMIKEFRSQTFVLLLVLIGCFLSTNLETVQVQAQVNTKPEINSVMPTILRTEGNTEVVIKGKNFSTTTSVIFDGKLVDNATLISESEIRFQTLPQSSAGAKTLTILSSNGIAQKELRVIDKAVSAISTGEITTIAGGDVAFGNGDLATKTSIKSQALAYDREGNLFIMETSQIRCIDAKTGVINTIVGLGNSTKEGDLAILSKIIPSSITVGVDGTLFILDRLTASVKKVDPVSKTIRTVAGGKPGPSSGDGGLATEAALGDIVLDIASDKNNNLFLIGGKLGSFTIRKIDSKTGIITTVAGNGQSSFSGDSGLAVNAGIDPRNIALDSAGNLFMTDFSSGFPAGRIRRVDVNTGIITTIAGNGTGNFDFNIDGKPATSISILPDGFSIDKDDNIVFSGLPSIVRVDTKTGLVKKLPVASLRPEGQGGGFGLEGKFTFNSNNNLVFNFDGKVFELLSSSPTGESKQIAGSSMGARNFSEDGSTALTSNLGSIAGVVSDISGNIFFSDIRNQYVRKIDARDGSITTIAGGGSRLIFSPNAGDGKSATSPEVALEPTSIALDSIGNLYIGDGENENVRRVDVFSNIINTFAGNSKNGSGGDGGTATNASLGSIFDVAFDTQNNLFISADFTIRRVDAKTKVITTIAGNGKRNSSGDGGTAANATGGFTKVVTDLSGNIFIVDTEFSSNGKDRVRRIDSRTGVITTVAGGNNPTFTGENGPATKAGLGTVNDIAVNSFGDLFISSSRVNFSNTFAFPSAESRIWRVDAKTGNISLLASNPNDIATKASIEGICQLNLDQNENLLITENDFLANKISALKLLKLSDKVKTSRDVFINRVTYQKPTLMVQGGGFGNGGIKVNINGQDVTNLMVNQGNDQLILKGKSKQLNLQKSGNQMTVTTSSGIIASSVFK